MLVKENAIQQIEAKGQRAGISSRQVESIVPLVTDGIIPQFAIPIDVFVVTHLLEPSPVTQELADVGRLERGRGGK